MMKKIIKVLLIVFLLLIALLVISMVYMSRNVYQISNTVVDPPPYEIDPALNEFHRSLFVADMHADTFNFETDFFTQTDIGQVDLPRVREGGLSLMTFAIATEIPFSQMRKSPAGNSRGGKLVAMGAIAQLEPVKNWFSRYERGLYSLGYARKLIEDNPQQLMLITYREDLEELRAKNRQNPGSTMGVVLSIEGSHIMEGDLTRLADLHERGIRMLSLTHAFDNEAGGSSEGVEKSGLTEYGESMLAQMRDLGIIVDIAHSSPALINDILDRVDSPVVYSHGGVQGMCDIDRNLPEDSLERIRDNGGLIAIGFWPRVLCGENVDSITASIRYVASRIGVEHVAIGSDFDGGVTTVFDASGLPLLTGSLQRAGFSEAEIRMIMGENYVNLLLATLPSRLSDGM